MHASATFGRRRVASGPVDGAPFKAEEVVAGRYLVKDLVGVGPLGFVFRAHDQSADVEVALKVIASRLVQSAEERKALAQLLRSARRLSHPNLARVDEEGEDRDSPYFTSQLLEGLPLRRIIDARLQRGQFFGLEEVEPLLSQVCAALEGARRVGPHSDLKPENVLVMPGLLKVTDFGLGLALPRLPFVRAMKAKQAARYLAPELVDGGEVDERADVYSVGVILGEMLSGLTPDGSPPELSRKNPRVPIALEAVYRRAVNANPTARHASAGELAQELRDLVQRLASSPGSETTSQPSQPVGARARTSPAPLAASSVREVPGPADATQPVDPDLLAQALTANLSPSELLKAISPSPPTPATPWVARGTATEASRGRVESVGSPTTRAASDDEDRQETRAAVVPLAKPPSEPSRVPFAHVRGEGSKSWIPVALLIVVGVALGAGVGLMVLRTVRSPDVTAAQRAPPREALPAARTGPSGTKASEGGGRCCVDSR